MDRMPIARASGSDGETELAGLSLFPPCRRLVRANPPGRSHPMLTSLIKHRRVVWLLPALSRLRRLIVSDSLLSLVVLAMFFRL